MSPIGFDQRGSEASLFPTWLQPGFPAYADRWPLLDTTNSQCFQLCASRDALRRIDITHRDHVLGKNSDASSKLFMGGCLKVETFATNVVACQASRAARELLHPPCHGARGDEYQI